MVRLFLRRHERRPSPAPLHGDQRPAVRVMTAAWAVAFVVALVLRDDLAAQGRGWWPWTCLVAVALGLYGLRWLGRLDD